MASGRSQGSGRKGDFEGPGTTDDLVGRVLGNTYEVVRPLGRGGMGTVYEATNVRIGKKFAIKVLSERARANQQVLERFRREALIATDIGHPHIIEAIDFDSTDDGVPYMVMEFLLGQDLSVVLSSGGPLPVERTVHIAGQICSALYAAHQHSVVHRDLKPANIFLCRDRGHDDFVKVLDFGISKILGASGLYTSESTLIGTPCFMAPEQAEGDRERIGPWTDIFALGTVLYQVLGGKQAFVADSAPALLYKIVSHHPPPLDKLRSTVSVELASVIARAMEKRPEDRFASMRELAEHLLKTVPAYTGPGRLIWERQSGAIGTDAADVDALSATQPSGPEASPAHEPEHHPDEASAVSDAASSDGQPESGESPLVALSANGPSTLSASVGETVASTEARPPSYARSKLAAAVGIGAALILVAVVLSRQSSTRVDETGPVPNRGSPAASSAAHATQVPAPAADSRAAVTADAAPAAAISAAPAVDAAAGAADTRSRAKIRRRPKPRRKQRAPDARLAPPSPATRPPDARPRPRVVPGVTPEW